MRFKRFEYAHGFNTEKAKSNDGFSCQVERNFPCNLVFKPLQNSRNKLKCVLKLMERTRHLI